MDHIQDVYKKKPDMINKIWDHLTKVNLKVDGKPFQVVYNEDEDELEYHGRSGNETKVGPLIDDMYRLFSKPINDAIRHIENRVEVFKRYKFLTFEVIDEILLLTAIITKEGKFVDDPDEIDEIAKELDTDVMPCLWKGKLNDDQRDILMTAISTDIVPTKDDFVKWVKDLFGTYKKFPKTLISRSTEFIEGIVFFYDVDGKVVEYKLVDPSFRQMVKDNHANMKQDGIENAEKYTEIYTSFLNWAEENAKGLDKNRMRSIEFNFIEMMKDPKIYNKLMKDGAGLTTITTDAYFLQPDRISDELKKAIKKHGKVYQLLYEKFVRLFYKAKKRGFVLSKEFQARVNKAVDKFADYSLNEDEIEINGEVMINIYESHTQEKINKLKELLGKDIFSLIAIFDNNIKTINKHDYSFLMKPTASGADRLYHCFNDKCGNKIIDKVIKACEEAKIKYMGDSTVDHFKIIKDDNDQEFIIYKTKGGGGTGIEKELCSGGKYYDDLKTIIDSKHNIQVTKIKGVGAENNKIGGLNALLSGESQHKDNFGREISDIIAFTKNNKEIFISVKNMADHNGAFIVNCGAGGKQHGKENISKLIDILGIKSNNDENFVNILKQSLCNIFDEGFVDFSKNGLNIPEITKDSKIGWEIKDIDKSECANKLQIMLNNGWRAGTKEHPNYMYLCIHKTNPFNAEYIDSFTAFEKYCGKIDETTIICKVSYRGFSVDFKTDKNISYRFNIRNRNAEKINVGIDFRYVPPKNQK